MQPLQSYLLQGATSYLEFLEQTDKGLEENTYTSCAT